MAAIFDSIPGSTKRLSSQNSMRFGSVEPAVVAALKHIDPVVAVLMLLLCGALWGARLDTALGAVAVVTFITVSRVFAHSERQNDASGQPLTTTFSRIIIQWTGVVAVLLFIGFAFKVSGQFSRAMMLTWVVATPVALYGAHVMRERTRRLISDSVYAPRYIIVGANNAGFELFKRMPKSGFLGFFDFRSSDRLSTLIDPSQLAGHCKDIAEFARTHGVTSIYIALPLSNVPRIGEMIQELRDTTASIYFVPDVFAFDLVHGRLVEINGMPALAVCDTPFYGMDAVRKRATDLVLACAALLVLAVPMLLIAVAVKLTSKGPVLFRQRRYGLNGEEILVYKYRSMTVCEDGSEVTQATKGDRRITRLGRFLRSTSLDELPQLFNVLEGKMSVVGPRPHAVAHNELYRKLISGYMIRHKVRPGITGLAQVNGLRGETETIEKMRERVRFDLEYLSHWSPWLDLKIICQTIVVITRDKNAY
ncbi:MAG TPA: undecaprenyl-phosphate glucose phosphotransferase [Steroidobacteraceae bacterium]|nr:undecaprenyl-phosphate glucose phosphotransferase [Steroidobacteraceae bacterium]